MTVRYVIFTLERKNDIPIKCFKESELKKAQAYLKKIKSKKARIEKIIFDGSKISYDKGTTKECIKKIKSNGFIFIDIPNFDVNSLDYEFEVGMCFDWIRGY